MLQLTEQRGACTRAMTNPGRSQNKASTVVTVRLAQPCKGADHLSVKGANWSPVADLSSVADHIYQSIIVEGRRNLAVGEEIPRPAILSTKDNYSQLRGIPGKVAVAPRGKRALKK